MFPRRTYSAGEISDSAQWKNGIAITLVRPIPHEWRHHMESVD